MKSTNQMKAEVNRLTAEISAVEAGIENGNVTILIEEVCNLFDGVGNRYVAGDYYAGSRVYSRIPGVKNIRVGMANGTLSVKVTSPAGKLLPETVTVRGREYAIEFAYSLRYLNTVDY